MFSTVNIRNWQSLRRVDLTLGRITVIVGPSSSGKSAFVRALRALTANTSGSSAVTRGATTASVAATTDAGFTVRLEHERGSWSYRLTGPKTEAVFTKLNRSVPDQVTQALGIPPGGGLNFAGQFDKPYLLTESGAAVARDLGELTNVDVIYSAVKEANRRKSAASTKLRTRREDLDRVNRDGSQFQNLPERLAACERAEAHAEAAARLHDQTSRLSAGIDILEVTEAVLAQHDELPPVPSIEAVDAAAADLTRFVTALRQAQTTTLEFTRSVDHVRAAERTERELTRQHAQILATLGTCPTCGQAM